jgi:hypothetical protein
MNWTRSNIYKALTIFFTGAFLVLFASRFGQRDDDFFKEQSEHEMYGMKFNETRKRIGLPVIKPGWYTNKTSVIKVGSGKFSRKQRTSVVNQVWKDWSLVDHVSGHYEKEIYFDMGTPTKEIDRYRYVLSDTLEYLLEVSYVHIIGQQRWDATLLKTTYVQGEPNFEATEISLVKADSVLSGWGMSRQHE